MVVPNISEVQDSKVALRWLKAVQNEISTEQFLTNTGMSDFEIRNAIEVNIVPSDITEDPIKVDFSWEIKSFTAMAV